MSQTAYSYRSAAIGPTATMKSDDGMQSGMLLSVANGTTNLGQNPASLKGKLQNLEETTKAVSDELSLHRKELIIIRSEKETLGQVLKVKQEDLQTSLSRELKRLEGEMHRYHVLQRAEAMRIQTQINTIRAEKNVIAQTYHRISQQITDIEANVGNGRNFF